MPIPDPATDPDPAGARLARLLCARLCHDLGGPAGTVAGALELAAGADPETAAEAGEVAREAAGLLVRKVRALRAAWGAGGEAHSLEGAAALLDGVAGGGRVRMAVAGGEADRDLGARTAVVLNAALLAAEALPRGGTVWLAARPDGTVALRPEGRGAAWPAGLAAVLAAGGRPPDPETGPRAVQAPLLAALALAAGVRVALDGGGGEGEGPALLLVGTGPG